MDLNIEKLQEAYNAGMKAGGEHSAPSRETLDRIIALEIKFENMPTLIENTINKAFAEWFEKSDALYLKKEYEEHIKKIEQEVESIKAKVTWAWAFGAGAAAVITILWNVYQSIK